ncbi:hypothetical protein D3C84_545970 [compost metagenome]
MRDEAAQGLVAVLVAELEAVERSDGRELGIAFQHEVAEEAQVQPAVRRLAEQLAEGRQVLLVADHAKDVAGFQGGTARRVQQLLAAEQRGDAGAVGHLQLAQGGAYAPFFGAQAVDEQLPLAGGVDLQPGAGDGRRLRRHRHPQ